MLVGGYIWKFTTSMPTSSQTRRPPSAAVLENSVSAATIAIFFTSCAWARSKKPRAQFVPPFGPQGAAWKNLSCLMTSLLASERIPIIMRSRCLANGMTVAVRFAP